MPETREEAVSLIEAYLEVPRVLERMHRRFLDILQGQLTQMGVTDLTPVQMFMLLDIGEDEISLQDLINRGHYQRSNALNNTKKLIETGHFEQSRSANDRRTVRLKLTPKALVVCTEIRRQQHALAETLSNHDVNPAEMTVTRQALRRLERSWDEYLRYGGF
ncbi:MAG TPA: winged helix DNA-binding protein [Stellaceae bacterium]|nr:winged helix DNA-binding protein [Stellaceae bacterium]